MSERHEKLEAIARVYDAATDFDGVITGFAWEILSPRLSGKRTLEMGCSAGVMTKLLSERVERLEVVDGSKKYLDEVARKIARKDVAYHHALFEHFHPTGVFDDIVMARALEHLPDPAPVLAAVRDWLAPEGQLHVMVPNALSFHRLIGVAMGMLSNPHDLSERDQRFGHHRVYDPERLAEELSRAGLEILEQQGILLKFLSNAQMMTLEPALWKACNEVGKQFPRHGTEIYARCRARRS